MGLLLQLLSAFVAVYATPPSVSVLSFSDLDLDAAELGGLVTWTPPVNTTEVAEYSVAFATDVSGSGLFVAGSQSVGTNALAVPVDTDAGAFTHVIVYSIDDEGEQSDPATLALLDSAASASGIIFIDLDLDGTELGGDVTWGPPGDITSVTVYSVFLATNADGASRSVVGSPVAVGTNYASLVSDTSINIFSHVVVYTASSLAEQTTPAAAPLDDTMAPVADLLFVDKDLDLLQLGGPVTWSPPANSAHVASYDAYWAEDASGAVRAALQSVAVGTNSIAVAPETALTSRTHVLVYARSNLSEQTTPAAHQLLDRTSSVTNLEFPDMDLDATELGGNVTWIAPLDSYQVTHYRVYFAVNSAGTGRSQLGADIPVATSLPFVPADTPKGSFTHLVVYTTSSAAEQTTPVGILLQDADGGVSGVELSDLDLDGAELGGAVTWVAPSDTSQLLTYAVYMATGSDGTGRVQVGGAVALHTNAIDLPVDTPLGSFLHIVVYSASALCEQTTPAAAALADAWASAADVAFTDRDLDGGELGGAVTWSASGNSLLVQSYRAFLATDFTGTSRSQLGVDIQSGTNSLQVPVDTPKDAHAHVVVYAASILAEQSTPTFQAISDASQSASSVSFTDLDLDMSEVGGTVGWSEPLLTSEVTHYTAYLASSDVGASRSLIGTDLMGVVEGTSEIGLQADTLISSHTHVVVFTRSSLAEQTTPAALPLVDQTADVTGISFDDLDADAGDIGGTLTWEPPSDASLVSHHVAYLAAGAVAGVSRLQLESDIEVGTNTLAIFIDTACTGYSHIAVHERSALAEQTTPAGVAVLQDLDGSVVDLTFGDRDFDLAQIGGVISWRPPADVARLTHYAAYLAEDASGTGWALVGSQLAVGTNELNLPVSTPLGTYSHVVVYSRTSLAYQTTPAAVVIADTPMVTTSTQWTIANAVTTTPVASGRLGTPEVGAEWAVQELVFYSDDGCSQALQGTHVASGQTGQYHGPPEAFDGNTDTAWHAQCAPCEDFEGWLGIVVQDVVRCVRWLQSPVTSGEGAREVAFQIGGHELARATGLRGGHWEGLRYAAAGGGWQIMS